MNLEHKLDKIILKEIADFKLVAKLISNGYLIHCSPNDFDYFDETYIKGGFRAKEGYGFYFSNMPYKPIEYGDYIYAIKYNDFNFLNSSNPIDPDLFHLDYMTDIQRLEILQDNIRNIREYDAISEEIQNIKNSVDTDLIDYIKDAIRNGAKTYGQLEYLIRNPNINIPKLIKIYLNNGYDGYVTDNAIFTVFNMNKLNKLMKKIEI